MSGASIQSCSVCFRPRTNPSPPLPTIHHQRNCVVASRDLPKLTSSGFHASPRIINFKCNSTSGDSGENETRTVLDAFFLGKALAEAFSERLESAVGELLSTVGRWEAEQQKQIQDFQDEVLEKARRAKEQAAREALEEKGLILKSTTAQEPRINGVTTTTTSSSASDNATTTSDGSIPEPSKQIDGDEPSSEIPDED